MFYLVLAVPALLSSLMIAENAPIGRFFEWIIGLEVGQFYRQGHQYSKLVTLFRWPFLLALLGLAIPTPIFFDFFITFIFGLILEAMRLWRERRNPLTKYLEKPSLGIENQLAQ